MNRRYRPNRRNTNYTTPIAIVCFVAAALLLWFILAKGESIVQYFKGETVVKYDSSEANARLDKLMADLSGDKARLLELANNASTRLGWINDDVTRRQVRWFLLERLLDMGLWDEAVSILPEVEDIASLPNLDRLAEAALDHSDYEMQLRLDLKLQEQAINRPTETELLLRSIRRTAETCLKMHKSDEAIKVISRLDAPAVLARFSTPELAAQAADLQMLRVDASTVKEHALQLVRNILEQANWPSCKATSRLMLEEVSTALRDNPALPQASLKEIETKLMRCRDALLDHADREHKLPECYLILGELRLRIGNYEGCAQALTLANAFAEGYGQSNLEWQLRVYRLRARANMARGAKVEALEDCRFLAEHESSPEGLMTALTYLSANVTGKERETVLARLWDTMKSQPKSTKADKEERARIAGEIMHLNIESGAMDQAVKWGVEAVKAAQAAYPVLSDGKALRMRLELALLYRRKKEDSASLRLLREIVKDIESLDETARQALDNADRNLYSTAVREQARTYLLMGDRDTAKNVVKKIKEGLPEKRR